MFSREVTVTNSRTFLDFEPSYDFQVVHSRWKVLQMKYNFGYCFVVVVVLKVHVMSLTEKNVNMFTNTGWDTV